MKYKIKSEKKMPTETSIKLIEDAIVKVKSDIDSLNRGWYNAYGNNHKTRLSFDVDYILEYIPTGAMIVEFGSIPPILTTVISNLKYKVQGIDIAPERFHTTISSLGLNIMKANIEAEKLPFDSNTFDAALFNEVFEHLRINPIQTMEEVFRLLKPYGILLLSTPNLTSLGGWKSLVFENKAPGNIFSEYLKLQNLGHMGHVRVYTPVEVCAFLQEIGFEIKEVIYRGTFAPKSYWRRIANTILFRIPRFRPYFSIVAIKPASKTS